MERFPPGRESPEFELRSVGRALGDLPEPAPPQNLRGGWRALAFTLIVLLALLAFVGWLLVGTSRAV
jgi:hypothetical protein